MARLSAVHPYRRARRNLELHHGCRGHGIIGAGHKPRIDAARQLLAGVCKGGLRDGVVFRLKVELYCVAYSGGDVAWCVDKAAGAAHGDLVGCGCCCNGSW